MAKIKVNDIEINYEVFGSGEPAVLMCTGLGGNMQNFRDNPALLNGFAETHTTVIYDPRGAGETTSGDSEYVTMKMLAADAVGLMEALGFQKFMIFGGSMGGMTALQAACDYPERIIRLGLQCTWCGGPNAVKPDPICWDYLTKPGCGKAENMQAAGINPLLMVFSQKTIDAMDPDTLAFIANQLFSTKEAMPEETFYRQQIALRDFDVSDRIQDIQCPTIIFGALYDILLPCENSITLHKKIRNSKFVLLENSAHAGVDDMELTNTEAIEFFLVS